jgi:hypothetical protein
MPLHSFAVVARGRRCGRPAGFGVRPPASPRVIIAGARSKAPPRASWREVFGRRPANSPIWANHAFGGAFWPSRAFPPTPRASCRRWYLARRGPSLTPSRRFDAAAPCGSSIEARGCAAPLRAKTWLKIRPFPGRSAAQSVKRSAQNLKRLPASRRLRGRCGAF